MSRLQSIGLTLGLLLAGGVSLWWMIGTPETSPPSRQSIEGLSDTVSIGWTPQQTATIDAANSIDALTALGFVHGMTRGWTLAVWRHTALGTLSRQFGKGLAPLDRHARRLGFGHHAREAYERLSPAVRRCLQAYVRGLNAALLSEQVRQRDPFVFFGLVPQRWKPWYPLAIERLLAWMGTDAPRIPEDESSKEPDFGAADRLLRRWLHLYGWDRSMAWAARPAADTARTVLFARHVLGASAAPLLQEITIRRPGVPTLVAASFPGAPLFPTGTTGTRTWTYLLDGSTRLDSVQSDTARIRDWYERITPMDGSERLVRVLRYGTGLMLTPSSQTESDSPSKSITPAKEVGAPGSSPAIPDSVWVLRWPGFHGQSDIAAWLTQANLRAPSDSPRTNLPSFRLIRGTGLIVDSTGNWTVQGQPPVVERAENSVLVGRSPWAEYQAEALQARGPAGSVDPTRWSRSDSSTWAATLLPRMLPDLVPLLGESPIIDDALSYLRNWNYKYHPFSIGAVLFERWMRAYRKEIGRLPSPSDSTYLAASRRRKAFRRAVDTLAAQYGTDVRRWRWEQVAPDRRYFPVWSADSLVSADLRSLSTTQFAPLERPGHGHPSALAGGPTLVDPPPMGPAPTRWDGWMRSGDPTLTVRRLRFDPSALFARPLLPRRASGPEPVSVSQAPVRRTTRLVPSQNKGTKEGGLSRR